MYIYRIYNLSDQCYIGSTTCGLKRRWQQHKSDYKRWKAGKTNNCGSFQLFDKYGVTNCFYELIETIQNENQLKYRERYWIEYYGDNAINEVRPVITEEERKEQNKKYSKQWYENNKEQLLKQKKEYRENNREEIAKRMKEYNKKTYTCECGSTLRKSTKARHERSIKHQSFLQTKE